MTNEENPLDYFKNLKCDCPHPKYQNNLLIKRCRELEKQRDEARRLWCIAVEEIESGMTNETRYEVAESKGWDCFAQQEGGGP